MLRLGQGTRKRSVLTWSGRAAAAAFGLACFSAAAPAQAHIILVSDGGAATPKDWLNLQDTVGDPQKPTPCGVTPGTTVPAADLTNIISTFRPGETITVTWIEIIPHSGHFRIAYGPGSPASQTATTFPDPVVTAYTDSTDSAASTVAVTPAGGSISPDAIVLADNLFPHCITGDPCPAGEPVSSAVKTYSTTVTLPTTPCTNCTLQLVQFMSNHGLDPSFFYHHCAAVTIAGTAVDAGSGTKPPPEEDAGSGSTSGTSGTGASGTGATGTATSGTATSGTAVSGTAASGTASSGTAVSGTAASGAGASGTGATSGGAASGVSTASGAASSSGGPESGSTSNSSGGCSISTGLASSFPAVLLGLLALAWRRRRAGNSSL